jgi:hypothetical protein
MRRDGRGLTTAANEDSKATANLRAPFSLWDKGWGRVASDSDTQALSPTLSQKEKEFWDQ